MALPIFQRTVTNSAGDIIVGAEISVFDESTGLVASIFSNRDGTTPLTNPFFTGSDGLASFYAQQGEYRISVSSVAGSVTWRYQPLIGTLDEGAAVLQAGIYAQESAGYANTAIDARDVAIGAANYKGNWEGKTGAGVIGESYLHKASFIYRLNVNLANLSTSEPSPTNTDWVFIQEVPFEAPCKSTLDLDFANQEFTIYTKTGGFVKSPLSDLVTQGRATAGSSVDAIGGITELGAGENRFTFDGETGEALGYLSEESRTNLLTNSEFPNGLSDAPSRGGLVTLDGMDLGNGAVNAIAFGYDGATTGYAYKNYTTSMGVTYTLSVFIQMTDGLPPAFLSSIASSISNDLSLRVSTFSPSPLSYKVTNVYGSIYKVSATYTATTTGSSYGVVKNLNNSPRTFKVTGWQLEVGSFPTSYIKTQASTVTRTADSMTRTLGQEWNPNEGTFVVELSDDLGGVSFPRVIEIGSVAKSRVIILKNVEYATRSTDFTLLSGAGNGVSHKTFPSSARVFSLSIINYTGGNAVARISVDGEESDQFVLSASNIEGVLGILSSGYSTARQSTGSIKRLQYYPRAFDALTLQRLSRIQ